MESVCACRSNSSVAIWEISSRFLLFFFFLSFFGSLYISESHTRSRCVFSIAHSCLLPSSTLHKRAWGKAVSVATIQFPYGSQTHTHTHTVRDHRISCARWTNVDLCDFELESVQTHVSADYNCSMKWKKKYAIRLAQTRIQNTHSERKRGNGHCCAHRSRPIIINRASGLFQQLKSRIVYFISRFYFTFYLFHRNTIHSLRRVHQKSSRVLSFDWQKWMTEAHNGAPPKVSFYAPRKMKYK